LIHPRDPRPRGGGKVHRCAFHANDLWIAATALANGMPVVTRNVKHFQRVPGLSVISY
jgi:predicted nucleic acid-binding protein